MIQNPIKKMTVDFSVNQIEKAVVRVSEFIHVAKLETTNPIMKQHTIIFSESFSLGTRLVINLNEVSENKTEITIEAQRVVGAFDKSVEITNANTHIQSFINILSSLLQNPDLQPNEQELKNQKNSSINSVIIGVTVVVIILIWLFNK